MPRNEYGAVQGLVDLGAKYYHGAKKLLSYIPSPKGKIDPTWHEGMVKEANESFQKRSTKRKVGGAAKKRTVAKRATPKSEQRKASSKRSGY